jgi:hypothetical protein
MASDAQRTALEAQSALASVLARHDGSLWDEEKRTLREALSIVTKLAGN